MKLIDLHCDTFLALYEHKSSLKHNNFHVSLDKSAYLDKYIQLAAIFTPPKLSDNEGWEQFLAVRENLLRECEENCVPLIKNARELEEFDSSESRTAFILTVEDARILDGKLERVRRMYELGVRLVTPLWGGMTCIGGSHNTDEGLSSFGKAAVEEMLNVGIIPDISHASFKATDDILDICEKHGKAPIATHMNSYTVRKHSRNLTDDRYLRLQRLGGIVGVSFCPPHLTGDNPCTLDHIVRHILYYHEHGAGHVSFGADYDGTDLPADLPDITGVPAIVEMLRTSGLSDTVINDICRNTAYDFLMSNLPK